MKNLILAFFLVIILASIAQAQPQHWGVLVNTQIEGIGNKTTTGNSTIAGIEGQSVHNLSYFTFVNNLTLTADKKGYLNSFGGALRLHSKVRYHLPIASDEGRTFLQAGFNASAIQYSGAGGYAKAAFQPTAGFGFDFSPPSKVMSIVASYEFDFKAALHAQKSFINSTGRVLDGWTWGQQGKVETAIPFNATSKWAYLINASVGASRYRRNPAVYGKDLGAELHKFSVVEISVGIGKFY